MPFIILIALIATGTLGAVLSFLLGAFAWLVVALLFLLPVCLALDKVDNYRRQRKRARQLRAAIRWHKQAGYDTTAQERELLDIESPVRKAHLERRRAMGYPR